MWQDHLRATRAAAEAETEVKQITEDIEEVATVAVKQERTADALSDHALRDAAELRSQALTLTDSNPSPNSNNLSLSQTLTPTQTLEP